MKKLKLITACVAILLFTNLLFAANPKKSASEHAAKMIEKLTIDVVLTDSQKTIIQKKATDYAVRMQSADSKADKSDKLGMKKEATQTYKTALDSTLTMSQRNELTAKQNERHLAIINKIKTKK